MTLSAGTKLGPYEILSSIGAGGMGEVYKARDTRLSRDVALKVIPEVFAADADRMARFEREAKLLASLNHPHIAAIFGLEESSSTNALIMELVEGPTLADRIANAFDGRNDGGDDPRHRSLCVAGASQRQARGPARGHLGVRCGAVRDAYGQAALHRRDRGRDAGFRND